MNKILLLTAFVPNDSAAAEKNTKLMISDLAKLYWVDVVYFKYAREIEYENNNQNIKVLKVLRNSTKIKIANVALFPFVYPLFSVRFNWKILLWLKKQLAISNYKAIIFDHSQMFLYAKFLHNEIPKIMLSHDIIAQRVGRSSNKWITRICKFSERYCLSAQNAHLFGLSQKDCNLINSLYNKKANVCCLYLDKKVINAQRENPTEEFIFIGKWSRSDNLDGIIWFFKEIVPFIDFEMTINIIGKGFPCHKIENNNPNVIVKISGFVDNPYTIIANAKAVLSPLFTGAGIKVKVIESLACGCPVIGTEIAFEGINPKFQEFMIQPISSQDWIDALQKTGLSIEKSRRLKQDFIADYQSETIPHFLKNQLLI